MLNSESIRRIQDGLKREFGVNSRYVAEVFGNVTHELLIKGVQDYFQLNQMLGVYLRRTNSNMKKTGQVFSFLQKYDSVVANFQKELSTNESQFYQALSDYTKALEELSHGKKDLEELSVFGMFMGQSTKQLNKHIASNNHVKKEELLCDLRESLVIPIGKIYRTDFDSLESKVGIGYGSECIRDKRTIMPSEYVWNVFNKVDKQQRKSL